MRARPKILLCTSYEEAWEYFQKYQKYIMGIISDINFPFNGVKNPDAGVIFTQKVKEMQPDIPILLQSSQPEQKSVATSLGFGFLHKNSPLLLANLKKFLVDNFFSLFHDSIQKFLAGRDIMDKPHALPR